MPEVPIDRAACPRRPGGSVRLATAFMCAAVVSGASLASETDTPPPLRLAVEGDFPALGAATTWLGSPPLTPASLRGKVVLVDFWTFSCINWMRTLPYVRAWAGKYRQQGLVVIGVHTPEFDFEKDVENVRALARGMRIDYSIAIDNDYGIWTAFHNAYWPALYFVDARGRIRHHQFGEGDYERSERVLQQLLAESGAATTPAQQELVSVKAVGLEAAADWANQKSPETYVGRQRAENFVSSLDAGLGRRGFSTPPVLKRNQWGLTGDWTIEDQFAVLKKASGRITYRFHARDLHLVMGPAVPGASVRFRVLLDGKPPGVDGGVDVDEHGTGTASGPRLYQLIRQADPGQDRRFEIEFLDPGVKVYSFTFG